MVLSRSQPEHTACQHSGCLNAHTRVLMLSNMGKRHVATHTSGNAQMPTHVQSRQKEFWMSSSYFTPDLSLDRRPAACQLHLSEFLSFLLFFGCKCHLERWRGHGGKGRWRSSEGSWKIRAMTCGCRGRFGDFGSLGITINGASLVLYSYPLSKFVRSGSVLKI